MRSRAFAAIQSARAIVPILSARFALAVASIALVMRGKMDKSDEAMVKAAFKRFEELLNKTLGEQMVKTRKLEERVALLEKLATDNGWDVPKQEEPLPRPEKPWTLARF